MAGRGLATAVGSRVFGKLEGDATCCEGGELGGAAGRGSDGKASTSNYIVHGSMSLFSRLVVSAERIGAVVSVHVGASLAVLRGHLVDKWNFSQVLLDNGGCTQAYRCTLSRSSGDVD